MTAEPPGKLHTTDRRPAVWPWLLVPLVTLLVFFALRTARTNDVAPAERPSAPASPSPEGAV